MAPTRRLAELFFDLRARTEGLQKDVATAERQMGRLTTFVLKNPVVALAAVGTAAAGAALQAIRMASEIEGSMRRVQASTAGGSEGIRRLRSEVADLAKSSGIAQAELARAAEAAARSSANTIETGQRLRAATLAATATGSDITEILGGLDQVLDLFNESGDKSAQVIAELVAAAKRRQPLADLFAQLQAAAPVIQSLNLDLPTTARALVALGESGLSTKQVNTALKELAEGGAAGRQEIERLASTIPSAADPMRDLQQAFDDATASGEGFNAKLRENINATLIDLGNKLLPAVNAGLGQLLRLLGGGTAATSARNGAIASLLLFGKDGTLSTLDKEFRAARDGALLLAKAFEDGGAVVNTLDKEQLAALERRLKFFSSAEVIRFVPADEVTRVRALLTEVQRLQTATAGGTGTGRAGRPTGGVRPEEEIAKEKRALDKLQEEVRRAVKDTDDLFAKLARDARDRRIELAEALLATGQATAETLVQLISDLEGQLLERGFTADEAETLLDKRFGFKRAREQLAKLKEELTQVRQTSTVDVQTGLGQLNSQVERANAARADAAAAAKADSEEALARAQRVGRQIEDIGRLTLAAADAFGVLSDEASKALSAVVDVGAGIGRIASGDLAGGLTQGIAGVLNLVSQFRGTDAASQERKKQHEENLAALRAIEKHTGDLVGVQASGQSIADITRAVETLLRPVRGDGGRVNEVGIAQLERVSGRSIKEIEALAKALGVTLDGTVKSYRVFLAELTKLDLEAFTEGFAGKIRQLEIEARLDPKAFEGIEGLIKRLKILAGTDGAPAIARALGDLDQLRTSEGRAKAIAELTDTLRNIGKLKPEDLGGLSLDQFVEEILATIDGLRAAQPAIETAGEKLRVALAALRESFEALDIDSIEEQTKQLADLLETIAPAFAGVTEGLDTASLDSIEAADARLRELFARREALTEAERGGLSLEEFTAALLELDRALDASREKLSGERQKRLDDAKRAEEDRLKALSEADRLAEEERAKQVRERIERARRESEILDEGPDASLRRLVDALGELSPALGGLLEGLDLSNPADLVTLNERIQALFESMGEGSEGLGKLSLAEFLEQLLAVDGSTDGLIAALSKLGEQVETVAERINAALSALDLDLDIAGITDPIERLKRTAETVSGVDQAIGDALRGIDLSTAEGRKKADQALQALAVGANTDLKQIILRLLEQIRGVPVPEPGATDTPGLTDTVASARSREALATAQAVTEVTANRWLDLMTTDVVLSRERNAILQQIFGSLASRTGPILPPAIAFPAMQGGDQQAVGGITVRFDLGGINFLGPTTVGDADELAQLIQRRLFDVLNGPVLNDLVNAIQRAGIARVGAVKS